MFARSAPRLLTIVLAAAAGVIANPAAGSADCFAVVNVDMWDVLYIRSRQTHRSAAVGAIAPDHSGVVRSTGPCLPKGASTRRQWCPVDYYPLPAVAISGYVKAYFVTPTACPPSRRKAP